MDVATTENSAKRPRLSRHDAQIGFLDLREMETSVKRRASPDHLKTTAQGSRIHEQTRAHLVSWMDGLARSFGLAPGTLRRAVSYVDRVLSVRISLPTDYELGLLGAAAVFTAAKYEERSTIDKLNAVEIARYCGFATGKEVIDMERQMLAALRYELGGPTAYTIVDRFSFTGDNTKGEQSLEIQRSPHQLVDYRRLRFMPTPSAVAASTVFLVASIVFALFTECISMEHLVFEL